MKARKILAVVLTVAMLLSTVSFAAFAEDVDVVLSENTAASMTMAEFKAAVADANGIYDGAGATVTIDPAVDAPNAPWQEAQYHLFSGIETVEISNVNFVFVPNSAYTHTNGTTYNLSIAELQTMSKNITYTNCSFDKVCISVWGPNTPSDNVTVSGCTFANVNARAAMHQIRAKSFTVSGCTITDSNCGIYLNPGAGTVIENYIVENNTFNNMLYYLVSFGYADYSDANIEITGNTATGAVGERVFSFYETSLAMNYSGNDFADTPIFKVGGTMAFVASVDKGSEVLMATTVDAAIAAADDGDTVTITEGTYSVTEPAKKAITVKGAGKDATVLTVASGDTWTVGSGAVVEDMTVEGPGTYTSDYYDANVTARGNATFNNVKFTNGYQGSYGCDVQFYSAAGEKTVFNNCEVYDGFRGIFSWGFDGDLYVNDSIVQPACYTINTDGGTGGIYVNNSQINGWTSYAGNHAESVFANCSFGNGGPGTYGYAFFRPYSPTTVAGSEFSSDYMADPIASTEFEVCTKDGVLITEENLVELLGDPEDPDMNDRLQANGAPADEIVETSLTYVPGKGSFNTFAEAVAATEDGSVINLLGNTVKFADTNAGVSLFADVTAGTTTVNLDNKSVKITNGTLDFTGLYVSDSVFRLDTEGESVAFENVKFVREATDPAVFACYIINVHTPTSYANFTNCEIDVADVGSFVCNLSGAQNVAFTDCDIELGEGAILVQQGGAVIDGCDILAPGADILYHNNVDSVINDSTVTARDITMASGALAVTGNSTLKLRDVRTSEHLAAGTVVEDAITIEEGSALYADNLELGLLTDASAGTAYSKTEAVAVEFEYVEETETSVTYNINLAGYNDEIINRLNSADLTFILTQINGTNKYEIIDVANDNIAVNPVENSADRYEFHFEHKDNVTNDTAETITIAQVKFTGYGKFNFGVDSSADTNAAHATTISDNIVDTFVPDGDTLVEDGDLIIDNDIEGAEIIVPKRDLAIKVSFPNAIEANAAAYQDMKITVTGPESYKKVIYLADGTPVKASGDCENLKTNEDVVYYQTVISGELVLNTAYTVTVEGAGYRTAKYTVSMTEAKNLYFWNNVMDNAQPVEISASGEEKLEQTVNFLAGDIVKDDEINVYDLSAVVSYFGAINLDKDNKPEYAKYDLNRDGKIDSKDVAYVLVSWGN